MPEGTGPDDLSQEFLKMFGADRDQTQSQSELKKLEVQVIHMNEWFNLVDAPGQTEAMRILELEEGDRLPTAIHIYQNNPADSFEHTSYSTITPFSEHGYQVTEDDLDPIKRKEKVVDLYGGSVDEEMDEEEEDFEDDDFDPDAPKNPYDVRELNNQIPEDSHIHVDVEGIADAIGNGRPIEFFRKLRLVIRFPNGKIYDGINTDADTATSNELPIFLFKPIEYPPLAHYDEDTPPIDALGDAMTYFGGGLFLGVYQNDPRLVEAQCRFLTAAEDSAQESELGRYVHTSNDDIDADR
jgi:hypothetical protein